MVVTQGIAQLPAKQQRELLEKVQNHSNFTEDNDPYKEHDFGRIEPFGEEFYWKIDYYDKSLTKGSEDPSNPECTTRVLTLMLAQEY